MRSTSEDGTARLYNRNRDLRIGGESKWLYHQRNETFELDPHNYDDVEELQAVLVAAGAESGPGDRKPSSMQS